MNIELELNQDKNYNSRIVSLNVRDINRLIYNDMRNNGYRIGQVVGKGDTIFFETNYIQSQYNKHIYYDNETIERLQQHIETFLNKYDKLKNKYDELKNLTYETWEI